MVDKTTFGQELKKIRLARGKSQKYFSYQLGLAVWTYGKIERDEISVGSDHLYNLLHNDRLTRKEQAILAEKYQEKVDDEWVETKPNPKPKPKKKKKKTKPKPKKRKIEITDS